MNTNNNIQKAKNVPPFVRYCSAIIPTMFDDSLSYYEALCALNKFLQTNVIDVINNNATVTEEYIRLTNELKAYVENYFDNLDVQEEINIKLDKMSQDGTLTAIISQFLGLGALAVFNTEADMIASEHLTKGAKAKTLGKNTIGDGFGAYYNIDVTGDIALTNGLYATLVSNFGGNNYIDEITVTQIRKYDTDCYVTTIPVNDSEGNQINLHVEYDTESPLVHADKTYSTITANASLSIYTSGMGGSHIPNIIGDSVLLNEYDNFIGSSLPDYYLYLGIKPDRSIMEFKVNNTTAEQLMNSGCTQVFDVFFKLVEHGVASDLSGIVTEPDDIVNLKNPRQAFGVKHDGTYIILTTDGRTGNDSGLTCSELQSVLIELGCYDAWNIDGGGSTSTSWKGVKINRNIDNNRTSERYIPYTLNFRRETINTELAKAYSQIGKVRQDTLEQLYESVIQNHTRNTGGKSCNEIIGEIQFGYGNNMTDRPIARSGYFINLSHSNATFYEKYNKQIYYERDWFRYYTREQVDGNFTKWMPNNFYKQFYTSTNQTIAATAADTNIAFYGASIAGNNDIDDVITLNDDNTFSIGLTTISSGVLVIRCQFTVDSCTAGDKFIALTKNGNRVTGALTKEHYNNDGNKTLTVEFSTTLGVPTDKYAIVFYGTNGDIISRRRLAIELR